MLKLTFLQLINLSFLIPVYISFTLNRYLGSVIYFCKFIHNMIEYTQNTPQHLLNQIVFDKELNYLSIISSDIRFLYNLYLFVIMIIITEQHYHYIKFGRIFVTLAYAMLTNQMLIEKRYAPITTFPHSEKKIQFFEIIINLIGTLNLLYGTIN